MLSIQRISKTYPNNIRRTNVLFLPQIEYAFENQDNTVSTGITARIYQVDLQFFGTYTRTKSDTDRTSFRTILKWNMHKYFNTSIEYEALLLPDEIVKPQHIARIQIALNC